MKVDIPKKWMLDVTVILSGVDENIVKKYIYEASVIELISRIWTDELNEWVNNTKSIYGD